MYPQRPIFGSLSWHWKSLFRCFSDKDKEACLSEHAMTDYNKTFPSVLDASTVTLRSHFAWYESEAILHNDPLSFIILYNSLLTSSTDAAKLMVEKTKKAHQCENRGDLPLVVSPESALVDDIVLFADCFMCTTRSHSCEARRSIEKGVLPILSSVGKRGFRSYNDARSRTTVCSRLQQYTPPPHATEYNSKSFCERVPDHFMVGVVMFDLESFSGPSVRISSSPQTSRSSLRLPVV